MLIHTTLPEHRFGIFLIVAGFGNGYYLVISSLSRIRMNKCLVAFQSLTWIIFRNTVNTTVPPPPPPPSPSPLATVQCALKFALHLRIYPCTSHCIMCVSAKLGLTLCENFNWKRIHRFAYQRWFLFLTLYFKYSLDVREPARYAHTKSDFVSKKFRLSRGKRHFRLCFNSTHTDN